MAQWEVNWCRLCVFEIKLILYNVYFEHVSIVIGFVCETFLVPASIYVLPVVLK